MSRMSIPRSCNMNLLIHGREMQWPPIRLEEYPQTNDGAVDFVQDVFKRMGGTIVPPTRPRKRLLSVESDTFLMDFENACLASHWDSSVMPHPRGNQRYEHSEWAAMIKRQVFPHHSDVDWSDYVEWVQNGGGDEWFQENETDVNG